LPERDLGEVSEVLSRKAHGDAKVLRLLAPNDEIGDDAAGFHAQQAIEKWLKAVIAGRGEDFEFVEQVGQWAAAQLSG
jgi:HEPN domain-containing protein